MPQITPKPRGLGPEYGAQFQDHSVAAAYPTRPPYPPEVFEVLLGFLKDEPRTARDLGCGTGDISRGLALRGIHVDAVDPSAAMLDQGRALPGGLHPGLHWILSTAEDFAYPRPYALAVMAESLHWMDWYTVLPRIRRIRTLQGRLASSSGGSSATNHGRRKSFG